MWLIIALIIVGVFMLVAELVLLPGLSIAGIGAIISFGIAIYFGFIDYGTTGGIITICSIVAVTVVGVIISLRAKTWQKLSLDNNIDSTSQPLPEVEVSEGDAGTTITRLAPMGNVLINGKSYEAKSLGDKYIDPRKEVIIVGFENFNIVVKETKKLSKIY